MRWSLHNETLVLVPARQLTQGVFRTCPGLQPKVQQRHVGGGPLNKVPIAVWLLSRSVTGHRSSITPNPSRRITGLACLFRFCTRRWQDKSSRVS